jgi:hypothetical protein
LRRCFWCCRDFSGDVSRFWNKPAATFHYWKHCKIERPLGDDIIVNALRRVIRLSGYHSRICFIISRIIYAGSRHFSISHSRQQII